jgi:cell shape-determining protein MreC
MLFWTLQITILSVIMIFLVHHLILFFKTTLTVPKIKDLVNAPAQKYENIYNTIASSKDYTESLLPTSNSIIMTDNTMHDVKSMKDELKNFLKQKRETTSENATNISSLDSFSFSSSGYSNY